MMHRHNFCILSTAVFQTLHNETGQEVGQKLCQWFFCKTCFRTNEQIAVENCFLIICHFIKEQCRAVMIPNVYPHCFILKLPLSTSGYMIKDI